jgi:hypothetical protein
MTAALGNAASLAARVGGTVVRQVRSVLDPSSTGSSGAADEPASRWLAVTVYRERTDVDTGELPAPLAELGDRIEARIRPAADAKGTELAVRWRAAPSSSGIGGVAARVVGADPNAELRSALRKAKQLLEVGEVLKVDPTPHGRRTTTPGGALLEAVTRRAGKGGVL